MSWFTQYIEHPFVAAVAKIEAAPAIANNPEAAQAVATIKAEATTIATTTSTASSSVVAAVEASADPSINALGSGLQAAVDAYLLSALGPVGAALTPAANALFALGEDKAHALLTALFAHAKSQATAPSK